MAETRRCKVVTSALTPYPTLQPAYGPVRKSKCATWPLSSDQLRAIYETNPMPAVEAAAMGDSPSSERGDRLSVKL